MQVPDHRNNRDVYLNTYVLRPDFPADAKSYGCLFLFNEDGKTEKSLKYEISIKYLDDIPSMRKYLFEVKRISPVYINDLLPELLVDVLAYETGKIYYPMQVESDYSGRFSHVHNQEEIIRRFPNMKEKIETYYKGVEVDKYLALMENVLNSTEKSDEIFMNDLFYATFFAPIYVNYTTSFSFEQEMEFPVLCKVKPLKFLVKQELGKKLTDYGAIEIFHSGNLIDERTAREMEQGENFPAARMLNPLIEAAKGTYEAYYSLDKQTRQIRGINAKWILALKKKKSVEVKIHQLDSDIQHEESPVMEEITNKKSFFSRIFDV